MQLNSKLCTSDLIKKALLAIRNVTAIMYTKIHSIKIKKIQLDSEVPLEANFLSCQYRQQ